MNTDDPKFTAHVLGELEDLTPAERAEIEALLASDPAAVAEAKETSDLAARLRAELAGEEAAPLRDEQRVEVLSAAAEPAPAPSKIVRFPRREKVFAAIAACLIVGVSVGLLFPSISVVKEQARKRAPMPDESERSPLVTMDAPAVPSAEPMGQLAAGRAPVTPESNPSMPQFSPPAPLAAPDAPTVSAITASDLATPTLTVADAAPAAKPAAAPNAEDPVSATQPTVSSPTPQINAPAKTAEGIQGTLSMNKPSKASAKEPSPVALATGQGPQAEQIKQLRVEADGFYETGRLDMAKKRADQVLAIDPANQAAQKIGEKADRKMNDYDIAAYNETRANAIKETDLAWQRPIRRFAADGSEMASNKPVAAATPASASAPVTKAMAAASATAAPASRLAALSSTNPQPGAVPAERSSGDVRATVVKDLSELRREPTTRDGFDHPAPIDTESYDAITDNAFLTVREQPLSTFSIDVDTASYAIVRRFLTEQRLPPRDAVRIEELLNYFTYDYPQPDGDTPFSATMEVATCPWTPEHRLVRVGLKGREIAKDNRPASNLVFLIDVSGSMKPDNKLPLVRRSLGLLVDQLGEEDSVGIVVYAGNSGCVLEPTSRKADIRAALDRLEAGGSTNGGSGIQLAYQLAESRFRKGATNRVILATDGDFNVGVTNQSELVRLIEKKAKSGVFLTVLGFGMGNLKDSTLEKLADKGNGNYAYIDTLLEGKKVLVEQMSGTLVTIAKDVKIQVEFNPAQVSGYRLIGYEKRLLAKEDFNDDTKDAGEIGAGHTVTALYEVVPVGSQLASLNKSVDALKYQPAPAPPQRNSEAAGDTFIDAYKALQEGEKKEESGDFNAALTKYEFATALLDQLRERSPAWQPEILKYRKERTREAVARVREKIGTAGAPAERSDNLRPFVGEVLVQDPKAAAQKMPASNELLTLKLRYKAPDGDTSKLLEFPLTDRGVTWEKSSRDFRFAAAVASYGLLLRESPHKGQATWNSTLELAMEGKGEDLAGYRAEFISLVEKARALAR
jgi:Ca-activated chloride channel family protein